MYCTARIDGTENPSGPTDQDIYLRALIESGSADVIEEGFYVSRSKTMPLALDGVSPPRLYEPPPDFVPAAGLPLRTQIDKYTRKPIVLANVRNREEKGSDVNVATHLIRDVFTDAIDGAVVVSNDSDLGLPLRMARERVPVGTVNPSSSYLAGALRGTPDDGVGGHWWRGLAAADFRRSQLPDRVGGRILRPSDW